MEKFESQQYRDNLAKEIKSEPDKEKRREILAEAQETEGYQLAKKEKLIKREGKKILKFKEIPVIVIHETPGNDFESRENEKFKNIALVTTTQIDLGIRALSGFLKDAGFSTGKFNLLKEGEYTEDELYQIVEELNNYDAIAISVTDLGFERVSQIVDAVKNTTTDTPVIMGGVHAMLDPKDCMDAGADAVCLGEGESGLIDLLDNWDERLTRENKNFVVKEEDLEKIDNLRAPLLKDINELTPDFSYNNYYVLSGGRLVELTNENLGDFKHHQIGHKNTLVYASDRGCPHSCTYCYNSNLRKVHKDAAETQSEEENPPVKYLRRKSIFKMVEELEDMVKQNPQASFLNLMNDDTAARTTTELQEFARLYKEKIGLPFYCMVSPQSLGTGERCKNKIQSLVDAGMKEMNMGIQTNEQTNKEVFNRRQSDKKLIETIKIISSFCRDNPEIKEDGKIDAFFDFIIHNPFETEDDVIRTIDLIKQFDTPFDQVSHSLFVGRTTKLREMYEQKKKEAEEKGSQVDVVLEDDTTGVSNFHDTEDFIDFLSQNRGFVINTIMEFMAGRHDEKMAGRIPRYAEELMKSDVFEDFLKQNPKLNDIVSDINITKDSQSIDLLINQDVLSYFKNNIEQFKKLYFMMNKNHPIRYTNQTENYQ